MQFYTDRSRPTRRWANQQIQKGNIPGRRQGGRYFVDVDAYFKRYEIGEPLIDKILNDGDDDGE